MNIYWKIGSYILTAILAVGALYWYSEHKWQQGYDQAQLEAKAATADLEKKYRDQESADRDESERKYAQALEEKRRTDAANRALDDVNNGLRGKLAVYQRRVSEAGTNPAGATATGTVGIDVFYECTNRYSELAKEAGRIADAKNALIDQVQK